MTPGPSRSSPLRALVVLGAIVTVSVGHYLASPEHVVLHNVLQRLYYVPILLGCAWFGLRGGVLAAIASAAAYLPHILFHWRHVQAYQVAQFLELAMFGVIALLVGGFVDREKRARAEAEESAAALDRALKDLEATVESLRRADRLASLGTLAAGMAHELRNPLGALGGAVDILDRNVPREGTGREFLDIVRREVERLNEITGKYLDVARPQPPQVKPLDLRKAIDSAAELVRRSAARTGVTIEVAAPSSPVLALADPVQVHQALVNLLLNATQAMPQGGVVRASCEISGSLAVASVRDHGPGLPEGPVERLFEPFFTTKPGGTGLGLAVSRRIALAHGGTLDGANAEGGGAVFTMTLPLAPRGAASSPALASKPGSEPAR